MKAFRNTFLVSLISVLLIAPEISAYTLRDEYVGGDLVGWAGNPDIVGNEKFFDIGKMDISFEGDAIRVDIYTRYLDDLTSSSMRYELGDLFVSTDGWKPSGTPSFGADSWKTGEGWEFALVMDNHKPGTLAGSISLFALNPEDKSHFKFSDDFGYQRFRAGQVVQANTDGLKPLATGTWSIHLGSPDTDTDDYLSFRIAYSGFATVPSFGFHYALSCANDVIEGGGPPPATPPIPEPTTMFLFGTGIVALAAFGRKRLTRGKTPRYGV